MKRRGRKRNTAAKRHQTTRAGQGRTEPAATPETMNQRARIVGRANERNQMAGYALGQLKILGHITDDQHDAGCRFLARWSMWSRMAEAGHRWPRAVDCARIMGRLRDDVDPEEWRRVSREVYGVYAALNPLQRAAVETVVLDDHLPPLMLERPKAVEALCGALDVLASRFIRHPVARAA